MDSMMIAAAGGMKARMESLDMLANNVANSGTAGFKSDREFYNLYTSPDAAAAAADGMHPDPSTLPVIERQWTDFSQGTLVPTGNPLDIALSGPGFFVAKSPSGPLYTRNGNFRLSKDGQLETQQGYAIEDDKGQPIQVDPALPVDISSDGAVRQQGQDVAQMAIMDFTKPAALGKRDGTYFQMDNTKLTASPATNVQLHQSTLENSNVPTAESAVRLVGVLRQFEMLQRAMSVGTQMNRSIEQIAKVGP
ncbi:MAG: flagellar hook basal-body protein [Bryobacteraceae bacterium]